MTEKTQVGTIDLTPSWEAAVRIYIACLKNPDASAEAHAAAEEDLLNLARATDQRKERGGKRSKDAGAGTRYGVTYSEQQWADVIGILRNGGTTGLRIAGDITARINDLKEAT